MKKAAFIITIFLTAGILIWFWQPIRSLAVMSVYSAIHEKDSIMSNKGFNLDIPGGLTTINRDWYPFVMTFNADNYSARNGEIEGMTILYNFPAFNPVTRTNTFYEIDSSYNSSFYGAYIVATPSGTPFCYMDDGSPDYEEVMHAFKFDYLDLVLKSLGESNFGFSTRHFTGTETDYIGYDGWTVVNATIDTNSVTHNYEESRRSYLQYGRPFFEAQDSFINITMYGRLYMRFFPEYKSTIILYVMAPDYGTITDCDENILSKTEIRKKP